MLWRLRRTCYRLAHHLLKVYWFLARPSIIGAKCVLTDRGRVLLVRHSYGPPRWDLPGGWVHHGEPPEEAARREAQEELGLSIQRWSSLGIVSGSAEHRDDTLHCFQADLDGQPLTLDRGELEAAAWFSRNALPAPLGRYVRRILALLPGEVPDPSPSHTSPDEPPRASRASRGDPTRGDP